MGMYFPKEKKEFPSISRDWLPWASMARPSPEVFFMSPLSQSTWVKHGYINTFILGCHLNLKRYWFGSVYWLYHLFGTCLKLQVFVFFEPLTFYINEWVDVYYVSIWCIIHHNSSYHEGALLLCPQKMSSEDLQPCTIPGVPCPSRHRPEPHCTAGVMSKWMISTRTFILWGSIVG